MPECAEVAIFANQLNQEYGGHFLNNVQFIGGRFLKSEADGERINLQLLNYPLTNVSMSSKGKFLYWSMLSSERESVHFFISLAMTGSFGKQQKHSAIRFEFENGEVFFNDPRHFGTFKVVDNDLELQFKLKALGWDPLKDPNVPADIVAQFRQHDRKKIGEFLMEQGPVICGIGNYLRSDLLHKSRISPFRLISSLSDQEIETICQSAIDIVAEAFSCGGASIRTYSDLYGIAGEFHTRFRVYGRKIDSEGYPVLKVKDKNGRMLHYVPEVQI